MYHELACYDRTDNEINVRQTVFKAIDKNFNSIALFPYYLQCVKSFLIDGIDVACPIDYPYGISDPDLHTHAILAAIRKGANVVDFVPNSILLLDNKSSKCYDEIETIINFIKEYNVTLRIILEYRLFEFSEIVKIGNILRELKVEYIIPATGAFIDSWDDNLAISLELTNKANINVITNGNIWRKKEYNFIKNTNIFGIRLCGIKTLDNIFGV